MEETAKTANGGPAFPGFEKGLPAPGMTLRDYFAGQALAGLLGDPNAGGEFSAYANDAYRFADAMIEMRGAKL